MRKSKSPVVFRPDWEDYAESYPDMITLDGFDSCIMGVVESCGVPPKVCYDADKCIRLLASQGMEIEEAEEYFNFNVAGGYYGTHTPVFLYRTNKPKRQKARKHETH